MAYAALQDRVPAPAWWLLTANIFWSIAYDTAYAMVDREDDLKVGMRTSAITFGKADVALTMACYGIALSLIGVAGWLNGRGIFFSLGLIAASACAVYHWRLIRTRQPEACFKAFLHNNVLGACIFLGIVLDYAV